MDFLCGTQEQILVVVPGLTDGICMGGKVRYGIDKPPTILADPGQVRSIVIAGLQIFLQTQVILPLAIGQILCNREKLIDELLHLAVRQFDVGQVIDSFPSSAM